MRLFANLNENMSLTKEFRFKENMRFEFRAEAFNVFNRVRFGDGASCTGGLCAPAQLQSSTFGVLAGAGSQLNTPRQLQLALKLYF